jgi:hypothetical protein
MPSTLKLGTVVLTKLDSEYNFMRYARGKQAVRDAVKDRSGFVLHLSLYRVDGIQNTRTRIACRLPVLCETVRVLGEQQHRIY